MLERKEKKNSLEVKLLCKNSLLHKIQKMEIYTSILYRRIFFLPSCYSSLQRPHKVNEKTLRLVQEFFLNSDLSLIFSCLQMAFIFAWSLIHLDTIAKECYFINFLATFWFELHSNIKVSNRPKFIFTIIQFIFNPYFIFSFKILIYLKLLWDPTKN